MQSTLFEKPLWPSMKPRNFLHSQFAPRELACFSRTSSELERRLGLFILLTCLPEEITCFCFHLGQKTC